MHEGSWLKLAVVELECEHLPVFPVYLELEAANP